MGSWYGQLAWHVAPGRLMATLTTHKSLVSERSALGSFTGSASSDFPIAYGVNKYADECTGSHPHERCDAELIQLSPSYDHNDTAGTPHATPSLPDTPWGRSFSYLQVLMCKSVHHSTKTDFSRSPLVQYRRSSMVTASATATSSRRAAGEHLSPQTLA